ncbi:class I SAM-dependent methyltransferase [Frigidibacter sp. SD6-1]|uniref:class I SAM-dependent methyltransferase n=1 Tax=Frigidibacter sp. SD6-1 TaxID=3032581 RepID=UPI0024DFB56C|nr:class I SAM-dependent methyltransferase [Frigidibacter sp. SD6-1]
MTATDLYADPSLAAFYDHDNHWDADDRFVAALAEGRPRILDLGCGTGRLAIGLAARPGARVTAADPARAMLDIARTKPGADKVRWIEADARHLRLEERFDLICLTGHAFQVFLTRTDRRDALLTIAAHLAPEGLFIFDCRNPERREWEEWTPERSSETRDLPGIGRVTSWNEVAWDAARAVARYETLYRMEDDGQLFHATSEIAFPGRDELADLIADAGLVVDRWLGDWQGTTFTPGMAELIPIGRLP